MGIFDSFKTTETPSIYGSWLYRNQRLGKAEDQIVMDYRKKIDEFQRTAKERSEAVQQRFEDAAKRQFDAEGRRNAQEEFLRNLQEQEMSRVIGTQRMKEARKQAFMRGLQGSGFQSELAALGESDAAMGIAQSQMARQLADQTNKFNYRDALLRNLGEGLQISMADSDLQNQRMAMQQQLNFANQQRRQQQIGQLAGTVGSLAGAGYQSYQNRDRTPSTQKTGYTGSDMTYQGGTQNVGGASYGTQSVA